MNNAASADDLKKDLQEFQIDANLANMLGLTVASSFTTPLCVAAQNKNDISDEWMKFYDGFKKTPPKAARHIDFKDAVVKANSLIHLSDIADFKNKSFKDLTDDQKAIIMPTIKKKWMF